jgi:hypothetical protein
MKSSLFTALLILCAARLMGQTPASTPAPAVQTPAQARVAQTHTSEIGFSYSLPLDWQVMDAKPMLPVVKQRETETATSEAEKKGIACVQIALMARNGNPPSIIEAMALPYSCFGQQFTDADLPAFAGGVAESLKKQFEISDAVYGSYKLGTHRLWIERAHGIAIANPEFKRTVEITCSLLQKGAVCWLALAADQESVETFERGAVTRDGATDAALVPADAFQEKKPIKMVPEKDKELETR